MRRREREEVAEVARRRLDSLAAELAGWRAEREGLAAPPPRPAFFEQDLPVQAGPPGDLPGATLPAWAEVPDDPGSPGGSGESGGSGGSGGFAPVSVISAPRGRPLPPEPSPVPLPGRHAVDRPGSAVRDRVEGWFDDRLPDAVRSRVALSGQHLLVLTGVLGVALALAGWLTLRAGSGDQLAPRARFVAQQTSASGAAATSPAPSGAASASGTVVVDVVGKVRRPGIVTLPTGSRVDDAVKRAGGALPGARTASLNLARVLVDGEQIVVGRPQPAAAAGPVGPSAGSAPAATGALVNLNNAGLAELDTLPGVGPVTAQKILDWRTANGSFTAVKELLEVDGIGDKTLADIAPRVTL